MLLYLNLHSTQTQHILYSYMYMYKYVRVHTVCVYVAGDTTGLESIYTVYEGHEVMFHVSTLLPYTPDNRQQVREWRHTSHKNVQVHRIAHCKI